MSIFQVSDYRPFLRDWLARLPKEGHGEINRIAAHAGVHPSLISQVLSDKKNLNLEQAQLVCEYLGLLPLETEFFLNLVQLQRAGTEKLKDYFRAKLRELKNASAELSRRIRQDRELSEEERATFYSHWQYAAIWLLTSLKGGQTITTVAEWARIPRERAAAILKFLAATGLCVHEDGLYKMGPQSIHLARGSAHLSKHHTNWRIKAIDSSDTISPEELMYSAPMSLAREDFKFLRERLAETIKEVTEKAIASEAEGIACFNVDFFWLKK